MLHLQHLTYRLGRQQAFFTFSAQLLDFALCNLHQLCDAFCGVERLHEADVSCQQSSQI